MRVRCLWNQSPHNAFTDLCRWQNRFWLIFREGGDHASADGRLRLLTSADGEDWASHHLFQLENTDLRDPKLMVLPSGALAVLAGGVHQLGDPHLRSYLWVLEEDDLWSGPRPIAERDYWVWRLCWHGEQGLGIGYGSVGGTSHVRLYRTTTGDDWDILVPNLCDQDYPNESAMVFAADGHCTCLLRRDRGAATALLGTADPPYFHWQWRDLGIRIGGPALLRLPDGLLLATVRLYQPQVRTVLCRLDPQQPRLQELVTLPSAGDCSYAGMVAAGDRLWISYYAQHEGPCAIYLADLAIDPQWRG